MTTWNGKRLQEARGRLRHPDGSPWTQNDVADYIGAGRRTYSGWERDEAKPQAHARAKLDELFADVAPADNTPGDPAQIQKRLTALLAEALTLVTQLDQQSRPPKSGEGQNMRWAARAREPEGTPPHVQWLSADAPSANREASDNQQDEAQ